jgi:alpha-N-arabinofuranosidase
MKTLDGTNNGYAPLYNGLSLHYYTVPRVWRDKGFSTGFPIEEYYSTLNHTLHMEELVSRHSDIMNQYDPEKKVGMIVDEWGTWYNVEPGTNPGFLYQQNTMRDAMVASINLDIFNKHSDRVKMANIAQLANVLQSVVLTEGEKMLLTPTYYVFKMFAMHQEATLIDSFIETDEIGTDEFKVPSLYESASLSEDGTINLSVTNLSATDEAEVETILIETKASKVEAEILTGAWNAYNTFDNPEAVTEKSFDKYTQKDGAINVTLSPASVTLLRLKKVK